MKILADIGKKLAQLTGEGFEEDISKRKGLYVARPVLNAEQWAKWAAKFGVPNPVAAGDLHVSILYSVVNVQMKPATDVISVLTRRAAFVALGQEDECLCLSLPAWELQDRNWEFRSAGAAETWPSYKPHMTLSYDAKGFELSDAALRAMPETVILGGEVHAALGDEVNLEAAANDDSAGGGPDVVMVTEIYRSAAKQLVEKGDLDVTQEAALRDILKRDKALAADVEVLKSLKPEIETEAPVRKAVEKEVVFQVFKAADVIKSKTGKEAPVFKDDDERHLVWGIASVSTIGGELVIDTDDEAITTRALEDFTIDLIKGQRAGKFEHDGEPVNHIVQALVLSDDLQKSLGIDLGMECLIVCTEVPDAAAWAEVKKGNWMHSIAGTMIYYEEQAADE